MTIAEPLDISAEMPTTTQDASVRVVPVSLIDANPWQPRRSEDEAHIQKLADSIAANGLLQIPTARRVGDRYQLAFGHSRLAAYKRIGWSTFPINVVELSDRQMADAAAAENVARKDLSAIELAHGIRRYIVEFQTTQIEAGKAFGYTSQSSISNLLRLLQLPDDVQQLVNDGKLAERLARQMVPLAKVAPDKISKAAAEIVEQLSAEGNMGYDSPDDVVDDVLDNMLRKHGVDIRVPWEVSWPDKPIDTSTIANTKKNEPTSVPACKSCIYFYEGRGGWSQHQCLQPACYQLKVRVWAKHETERVSKELGIPVATDAERKTAKVVFAGAWNQTDFAKRAIKSRHESLRLAPMEFGKNDYGGGQRKEVFESEGVILLSTNPAALAKALPAPKEKSNTSYSAGAQSAEYEKRERERQALGKRVGRMSKTAIAYIAPKASLPAGWMNLLRSYMHLDKIFEAMGTDERTSFLLTRFITQHCDGLSEWRPDPKAAKKSLEEVAGWFGVKLPAGWDAQDEPAKPAAKNAKTKMAKAKKAK